MIKTRSASWALLGITATVLGPFVFGALPTTSPDAAAGVASAGIGEPLFDESNGSASDAQRFAAVVAGPSQAGYPRPYHESISVSTYSQVNTAWGNLLTVLPITGWDGRGPALDFKLYHNSYDGLWSTGYSAYVKTSGSAVRYVVTEDGMQIKYTLSGGQWVPEQGFHATLVDDGVGGYLWTLKDQTVYAFSSALRLTAIIDAAGNVVNINRDPGNNYRITSVVDASGRGLNFSYVSGLLSSVSENFSLAGLAGPRTWSIGYDAQSRLSSVTFPTAPPTPAPVVGISQYDADGRILMIADKNGDAFNYAYNSAGRIQTVTDPGPYTNQTQQFTYPTNTGFPFQTNHTDRRGGLRKYSYSYTSSTPRRLAMFTDPYASYETFIYDSAYNVVRRYNELGKLWRATYDGSGNLLTTIAPLLHTTTYTYDASNNLLSVMDAEGNVTEMRYEAGNIDPTAVTTIVLAAVQDPPELEASRTITLDYWGEYSDCCFDHPTPGCDDAHCESIVCDLDEFCCTGNWDDVCAASAFQHCTTDACSNNHAQARAQLRTITDPNGVETRFMYDEFGQPATEVEGAVSEYLSFWKVFTTTSFDGASRLTGSSRYGKQTQRGALAFHGVNGAEAQRFVMGTSGASHSYGAGNNPSASQCYYAISGGSDPNCLGFPPLGSEGASRAYDAMERLTASESTITDSATAELSATQSFTTYDSLGRIETVTNSSTEPTWNTTEELVDRGFNYTYDDLNGVYTLTGPDGGIRSRQTDLAGRALHLQHSTPLGMITADYTYYATGRVATVTYGNNTRIVYEYYDNETLKLVRHERILPQATLLQLFYSYDDRNLITQIAETDELGFTSTITFTYDARGRLVSEQRIGDHAYALVYSYDQGGNRLSKTDLLNDIETAYHYDLENPTLYLHKNNRLIYYEVFDIADPGNPVLTERVDHEYALGDDPWAGSVTQIIRKVGSSAPYDVYSTCLSYNNNAQLHVLADRTWQEDAFGVRSNETVVGVTEFRGSGRARYLVRQLSTTYPHAPISSTAVWSDYDGDEIYSDYAVNSGGVAGEVSWFEPGLAQGTDDGLHYFHADHVGSARLLTDSPYSVSDARVYTAFGELVYEDGTVGTRYRYAGAHGYEAIAALGTQGLPLLHVGYRTYDPTTGRFLQRDPTGLRGGANLYEYTYSIPSSGVDPLGFGFWDGDNAVHDWVARNFWLRYHSPEWLESPWATCEAIGLSVLGGVAAKPLATAASRALPRGAGSYIRFEAHPIGGLTGRLRTMRLFHMNVGPRHFIFDPRYWFF